MPAVIMAKLGIISYHIFRYNYRTKSPAIHFARRMTGDMVLPINYSEVFQNVQNGHSKKINTDIQQIKGKRVAVLFPI